MAFRKFCPKCGIETEELEKGFCKNCKPTEKITLPASIKVFYCKCSKILEKNIWIQYTNIHQAIRAIIKNKTKLKHFELDYPSILFEGKVTLTVTITSENDHIINLIFTPRCCDICSRKAGNYYEGTVQIRGNINKAKEIKEYIENKIQEYSSKYENCFIINIEKNKYGYNFQYGSKKAITKIIKELKKTYSLDIKESFEMAGMKDGIFLSRKTYAVIIND
jgi:nonsense-mediated mRNA decay protein 3